MSDYRNGDQVLFETAAVVLDAGPNGVTIRFGDTELRADPEMLTMVKRSIHVRDNVRHNDDSAIVTQTLEEGVFLIRVMGETGPAAYRVASAEDLKHDNTSKPSASVAVPAPAAPAPAAPAPAAPVQISAPAPAPAPEAAPIPVIQQPVAAASADAPSEPVSEPLEASAAPSQSAPTDIDTGASVNDELLLTDPIIDGEDAEEEAGNTSHPKGVAGMATSLTSMITRRRNLEQLGTTELLPSVTETEAKSDAS